MPTKKSGSPWKLTLLSTLAAGGAGYYAYDLRETHVETKAQLDEASLTAARFADDHARLEECTQAREVETAECEAVEDMIGEMRGNLSTTKAELASLHQQREETATQLAAFKDLTDRFRKMIDSGKLDVVIRDGRMVVELPAGVLFDSGKAELSREGELALMEVAVVLRDFRDRKFMVEGHTDDRPLESAAEDTRYRNNWELSAGRAITVVQFLIEAKMKPQNLLAAGHGEFDPEADNKTAAGRQQNRRIEIILLPDVQALPMQPDSAEGT